MITRLNDTARSGYWPLGLYISFVATLSLAVFTGRYQPSENSLSSLLGLTVVLAAAQVYFLADKTQPGRNDYDRNLSEIEADLFQ